MTREIPQESGLRRLQDCSFLKHQDHQQLESSPPEAAQIRIVKAGEEGQLPARDHHPGDGRVATERN